jgi:hypothetical protein
MTFAGNNSTSMRTRIAVLGVAGLLAVNAVLLVTEPGLALPRSLASYFFGPRLVRAEVVVRDNGIRQFRLDRGRVLRTPGSSLLIREADGTVVTVPVAPDATILLDGKPATFGELLRGMVVKTVREGGAAASDVRAQSR